LGRTNVWNAIQLQLKSSAGFSNFRLTLQNPHALPPLYLSESAVLYDVTEQRPVK